MKIKIIKKKSFLFLAIIVFLLGISSFTSMVNIVAADEANLNSETIKVSTSENITSAVAAINSEKSLATTFSINSDIPGSFNVLDYKGNPQMAEQKVNDVDHPELYYPVNMDFQANYYLNNLSQYQTNYIRVKNNSLDYGTYNIDLKEDRYYLKPGGDLQILMGDKETVVYLECSKAGVYRVLTNPVTINYKIYSSTGEEVQYKADALPDTTPSGTSMGHYIIFPAFETGDYAIHIYSSADLISLHAEYIKPTPLKLGQTISHAPKLDSDAFFNPTYEIYVYSVELNMPDIYLYSFNLEYGSPSIYFAEKVSSYYCGINNLGSGTNQFLSYSSNGPKYIIIDNPQYFSWNGNQIQPNQMKYTLTVKKSLQTKHEIGSFEYIQLDQNKGCISKRIEVSGKGVLSVEVVPMGANHPILHSSYGNYLLMETDELWAGGAQSDIYTGAGYYNLNYFVSPGVYVLAFFYSGSGSIEYCSLNTSFRASPSISTQSITRLEYPSLTDVKLDYWNISRSSVSYGGVYGDSCSFKLPGNFSYWGYNISLFTDKNKDIWTSPLNADLGFLWDDTSDTWVDYSAEIQPGNSAKVPLKTNGAAAGDAFVFGAYDKFDQIYIDIADPADSDNFTWQYRTPFGWFNFDSSDAFVDGTRGNNGSLEHDGTISWDPDSLFYWHYFQSTTNSSPNETPDTDNRPLYLIRVVCNLSSASIPNITSVTLNKYIRLRMTINSKISVKTEGGCELYQDIDSHTQMFYFDRYDNITYQYYTHSVNLLMMQEKDAIIYFDINQLYKYNYNGSNNGVSERIDTPIIISFGVYKYEIPRLWLNYEIGDNVPTHSSDRINLTEYSTFDKSVECNASEYNYIYLDVQARDQFLWTQLNIRVSQGNLNQTRIFMQSYANCYDFATFTDPMGLNQGIISVPYSGSNMNLSTEFGAIEKHFIIEFIITNNSVVGNSDNYTRLELWLGQFNNPVLIIKAPKPGVPSWVLYTIIGAVAGVAFISAMLIIKKKRVGGYKPRTKVKPPKSPPSKFKSSKSPKPKTKTPAKPPTKPPTKPSTNTSTKPSKGKSVPNLEEDDELFEF